MTTKAIALNDQGILCLSGDDRMQFLQGLITNDVEKTADGEAIYAAMLTPQGKYLFDFFIIPHGDALLLQTEAGRIPDLMRRLMMYKLRADVVIKDISDDWQSFAVIGDDAATALHLSNTNTQVQKQPRGGYAFIDPRHKGLGARLILPKGITHDFETASFDMYETLRLTLGIPDSASDITVDKRLILEANFDALNGIDFNKGCYVGQEITSRMRYRGKVRKRLLPIQLDDAVPADTAIIGNDGKEVGTLYSSQNQKGIALFRIEDLDKAPFHAGNIKVTPFVPDWLTPYLQN